MLTILLGALLSAQPRNDCPVTFPNGVMAGSPERVDWSHGNQLLSVGPFGLWPDGIITFRPGGPGFVTSDGALGMKFGWTRGVRGTISATGRRVDYDGPPVRIRRGDDSDGFQASYLIFPVPGCWEVTARLEGRPDSTITFVTKVVKVGEGPSWRQDP
jgi:hypothetical protein